MTDYQFDVINRNLKERPKGKWIEGYHDYFETLDCSLCGYVRDNRHINFNFCPQCGADMRGND
jgi:rubrerythrin